MKNKYGAFFFIFIPTMILSWAVFYFVYQGENKKEGDKPPKKTYANCSREMPKEYRLVGNKKGQYKVELMDVDFDIVDGKSVEVYKYGSNDFLSTKYNEPSFYWGADDIYTDTCAAKEDLFKYIDSQFEPIK